LYNFKFKKNFSAGHGGDGSKNRSSGNQGEDIFIEVPLGTVVRDTQSNDVLFEITEEDQEEIILKGGLGGRGNWHFKSSTRQTPRYAQSGIEGLSSQITLELKILADVGLVGFPNAGKSSLLAALTSAKPKIADYEFTTLKPNLGIVDYRDYRSFVMADIPGIIEGAAEGKGLGYYFLRHIERNSILLFVIPSDSKDVKAEFEVLHNELKQYNPELLDKKFMVIISKGDLLDDELKKEYVIEINTIFKVPSLVTSSFTQYNLSELKDSLWKLLNE
jgi:GTP-binding protein